ncbi:hypothetical protein IFR04_015114 [Cadophora malorum]|uniref:Uncharacterized protein n=1 Tax=Cadophora malorum TaxID=108018 RepID=A0A8H7T3N9_9HELO|nr:hypothetical protein IFR04_015114 [Cadophora malorum]
MPSPTVPGLRHLIPVLSSTASVSFRLSEYWTLIPFLRDDIPPQSLARFWESFLYRWLGFGMTSALMGYFFYRRTVGLSRRLYGWGVLFTLSHYVFGYYEVSQVVEKIVHGPPEEAKALQKFWLQVHTARALCSVIPAMVRFIIAYLNSDRM